MTQSETPPPDRAWTPPWGGEPSDVDALKRENPKGRLFEFCARARCGRPKLTIDQRGTAYGVAMRIVVHGREFATATHWAKDRTLAEQLAAQAILEKLAESEEDGEPGEWVSTDDAERLRVENPKGALLEKCVLRRLAPVFDVRPIVVDGKPGFEVSAYVTLGDGREVWGDLRRGAVAKAVEQAAACSLLERMGDELVTEAPAVAESADDELDARSALNELRQRGRLSTYAFTVERIDGPPHAPAFHMTGYAVRASGERLLTSAIGAPSKKEGEKRLAVKLLELVRTHARRDG